MKSNLCFLLHYHILQLSQLQGIFWADLIQKPVNEAILYKVDINLAARRTDLILKFGTKPTRVN